MCFHMKCVIPHLNSINWATSVSHYWSQQRMHNKDSRSLVSKKMKGRLRRCFHRPSWSKQAFKIPDMCIVRHSRKSLFQNGIKTSAITTEINWNPTAAIHRFGLDPGAKFNYPWCPLLQRSVSVAISCICSHELVWPSHTITNWSLVTAGDTSRDAAGRHLEHPTAEAPVQTETG